MSKPMPTARPVNTRCSLKSWAMRPVCCETQSQRTHGSVDAASTSGASIGREYPRTMLRLQSVSKRYASRWAVEDLTLEIGDGEVAVLIGPSGCGKSTTLKMVNRLVEPTSGRVYLDDEDVTDVDPVRLRRRMGYVIQHVGLFPHQTVAGNVATVPRLLGWERHRVRARVDELLDLVGLEPDEFGPRYPDQLSGGQRQRVG